MCIYLKVMTNETQQQFLEAAKADLGVTWDAFAKLAGINPRTFKAYRMPADSKGHRTMNKFVLDAVVKVLSKHKKNVKNSF